MSAAKVVYRLPRFIANRDPAYLDALRLSVNYYFAITHNAPLVQSAPEAMFYILMAQQMIQHKHHGDGKKIELIIADLNEARFLVPARYESCDYCNKEGHFESCSDCFMIVCDDCKRKSPDHATTARRIKETLPAFNARFPNLLKPVAEKPMPVYRVPQLVPKGTPEILVKMLRAGLEGELKLVDLHGSAMDEYALLYHSAFDIIRRASPFKEHLVYLSGLDVSYYYNRDMPCPACDKPLYAAECKACGQNLCGCRLKEDHARICPLQQQVYAKMAARLRRLLVPEIPCDHKIDFKPRVAMGRYTRSLARGLPRTSFYHVTAPVPTGGLRPLIDVVNDIVQEQRALEKACPTSVFVLRVNGVWAARKTSETTTCHGCGGPGLKCSECYGLWCKSCHTPRGCLHALSAFNSLCSNSTKWVRGRRPCFNLKCPNDKPGKKQCPCLQVSYCSVECQRADWKSLHRDECKCKRATKK